MISKLSLMLIPMVLVFAVGGWRAAFAAPPSNACSMLTQAQVSAAVGVPLGPGKTSVPGFCEWTGAGKTPLGTRVQLEIVGAMGGETPVQRFDTIKRPLPVRGVVKTPASDVGDDAVYVTLNQRNSTLAVRKGDFVFEVRVYGLDINTAKDKEKSLALEVLAKV